MDCSKFSPEFCPHPLYILFKGQENAAADIVVRNEEEVEISIGNPGKVSDNFSEYKGKIRILRIIKDIIAVSISIFYKKPGTIF